MGTQKPEHAKQRVESSQELLEVCNADPEDFHTRLVTGDETWLHHWDPDTKKESMQWKHPGSPPPKKFRTQPSASKVMATVFWDSKRDYIDRLQACWYFSCRRILC